MRPLLPTACAALLLSVPLLGAGTDSPASALVEAKVSLESALEGRLQAVLRKVRLAIDPSLAPEARAGVDENHDF